MIVLFLLSAFALTACATNSKRPAPAPMEPPRVDCQRAPPAQVPPVPPLGEMDAWGLLVMAVVEAERAKWQAEQDCLGSLRAKGVIR